MIIVSVDPRNDKDWRALVERNPSSVFHSPEWFNVLADTYGFDVRCHLVFNGSDQPEAGMPFCRIADIRGERIVCLPFSDYCDPLVNDAAHWKGMMDEVLSEGLPVTVRSLHNSIPQADERFRLVKQAKWHGMDLQRPLDEIWNGIHEGSRRAIRKAQKSGVSVRVAQSKEELRKFFEMHLKVRICKYHLLAQPYRFFECIWEQFLLRNKGALLLAEHDGEIIAGILFLEWKNTLYYKFNASVLEDLVHRPNDMLIWEGIQYGKTKGLEFLDFGLSDSDQEGLVRYKRKFATEEKDIQFLKHDPGGPPSPQEKHLQELLPVITNLFTHETVPASVSEQAGEVLYRFFT